MLKLNARKNEVNEAQCMTSYYDGEIQSTKSVLKDKQKAGYNLNIIYVIILDIKAVEQERMYTNIV